LRPRELAVGTRHTGPDWLDLPGVVRLSERLGRHVEVDVDAGGLDLIAVAGSDEAPREGEPVTLQIHLPNLHVFAAGEDGEDTVRLGSAAGPIEEDQ
jgi:hypothetical protein